MRWGTPQIYSWLWKQSGPTYKNELMFWLQTENPALHQLTLKEISRDSQASGKAHKGAKQKTKEPPVPQGHEHEGEIQDMGDDLLA